MILEIKNEAADKMGKTIHVYKEDLQSIRAGRANPSILDKIVVDFYGQQTPLKQVGSVSAPEPRLLVIQPWDSKLIPIIEKEILKSDLGLNPSNDGKVIRLLIPQLTEERRRDLTKLVKKNGEEAKVAVRNTRRDAIERFKKLEKNKEITEDDRKLAEEEIQKLTDRFIIEIDLVTKKKEEELFEI